MTIKQYVSQMRKIPGGRFTMGRTYAMKYEGTYSSEVPAHPVDISPFSMGATQVTVGMWREYLRVNPTLSMPKPPEWGWIDSHPMVIVSWIDIMGHGGEGGYSAWASRVAGFRLSLPTVAQWEIAARGGKDNLDYPWGNDFDYSKLWCSSSYWFDANRTAAVDRIDRTYTNSYGLTDMVGNVWHWCSDFSTKEHRSSLYPQHTRHRIICGGGWEQFNEQYFQFACRGSLPENDRFYCNVGFRLCAGISFGELISRSNWHHLYISVCQRFRRNRQITM